jgi:hypothetical protein
MDLTATLQQLYPPGSNGGQCGDFAHCLIDFPSIGDSFALKKQAVRDFGILPDVLQGDFRPGDVIVTSEGTFLGLGSGHVAVVNFVNDTSIFLTESNFSKNGKVTHGRRLDKTSPKIYGVIKGPYKFDVPTRPIQISFLMNYPKALNSSYFGQIKSWFDSHGLPINIFPVYTKLSGWKYKTVMDPMGSFGYDVIDQVWFDEYAQPLAFAGDNQRPDLTILCVSRKDWQGGVFNAAAGVECGWYYYGSNKILLIVDESDISLWHYGVPAIVDYAIHEVSHWLYYKAGDFAKLSFRQDNTHKWYLANQMDQIFNEINLKQLAVNL